MSKIANLMFSSTLVSIVISICLFVNLFAPGFSTVVKGKGSAFPCAHHTCGCKTAPDCLNHCCCAKETDTPEMNCLLKEGSNGTFSAIIQSLACAGIPDQFTAISYNLSPPEDGAVSLRLFRLYYMGRLQVVFPVSIKMFPPDKPPRIT